MKWNFDEVLDVVLYGWALAAPFSFAAAGYSATHSFAVPMVFIFIAWCGYVVGRRRSLAAWQKRIDERIMRVPPCPMCGTQLLLPPYPRRHTTQLGENGEITVRMITVPCPQCPAECYLDEEKLFVTAFLPNRDIDQKR